MITVVVSFRFCLCLAVRSAQLNDNGFCSSRGESFEEKVRDMGVFFKKLRLATLWLFVKFLCARNCVAPQDGFN